jgi:hypothetical protein
MVPHKWRRMGAKHEDTMSVSTSGVSVDQASGPGADFDIIAHGDDAAFMDRLQRFQDAKAAADASYERLGVGKNAAEQMDLAARMVNSAKEEAANERAAHLAKIAQERESFQNWVNETRQAELAARTAAESKEREADAKLAAADENHAASVKALNEANDKLAKAQAAHEAVMAASAALNKAVG